MISNIRLPEAPKVHSLYRKAHDKLNELWGHRENRSEERWREIFRLLCADKETSERFRQGFSQMLALQYQELADRSFELVLRQFKNELPKENFCCQLKDYLSQGNWGKADEETAWLFYLVMVQQGYKNWDELSQKIPSDFLNEIDQLWVEYSKKQFGFRIQKSIWSSLGGKLNQSYETVSPKKFQV